MIKPQKIKSITGIWTTQNMITGKLSKIEMK